MQQTHAMDNKHYGTQRRIDGQQWCYKTDPAEKFHFALKYYDQ